MVTHFTIYDGEFGGLKYILTSKPTKSENEIIVPRKQPIKIAKHYSVCCCFLTLLVRNISDTVLLPSFCLVFIFSMPSEVIIIVIQFSFMGINSVHFRPFSELILTLGHWLRIK